MAAENNDGALYKLEIPLDLARRFFQSDSHEFPILSNLSFDDYDLFSDIELEYLVKELLHFLEASPSEISIISAMVKIVSEAKSLGKCILFDPFRDE